MQDGPTSQPTGERNVASQLDARVAQSPDAPALFLPTKSGGHTAVTFAEFAHDVDRIARGLRAYGVEPGERVAVMVPPGREFFALTFALLRMGSVLVMIDPGIGLPALRTCLGEAAPTTFVGVPKAQIARRLFGWAKGSIKRVVHVGFGFGGVTLERVRRLGQSESHSGYITTHDSDPAAILFTSGSTGTPKGAVYTHGIFCTQVEWIRETYGIEPGEIDLPTFPLFALFDPALGMAAVIPRMDFSRPGRVDPRQVIEPIQRYKVTNMFGSPAVIRRVGQHVDRHGVELPSLRRVLSAGAPATPPDLDRFRRCLTGNADVHTPYGATEALPVSSIAAAEVLSELDATRRGRGICVGRTMPGIDVAIIEVTDAPIPDESAMTSVAPGTVGEITVAGPVVTREYFARPEATTAAKIKSGDQVRHRMGDLGYLDEHGRLWFCGRKSHRVMTPKGDLYTLACEGVFNGHVEVRRTALVGVGAPGQHCPVLCVELEAETPKRQWSRIEKELRELGRECPATAAIGTFLLHPSFPVDIRHNSKIFRERLAEWAAPRVQ